MTRSLALCAALALLAGCGISDVFPPANAAAGGNGSGGPGGNSGGRTSGNSIGGQTIGGQTIGGNTIGGNTIGGNTNAGNTASSTGRQPTTGGVSNGTVGGNTGTNGGVTGGKTSGGNTGGRCASEFDACDPSIGCPCTNLSCVFEPLKNGFACEEICKTTADCKNAETVCNGKACTIDLCGTGVGGPPNGSFDGPCDSQGTDDGTCVPIGDGGEIGVCFQGGSADGGCKPNAERNGTVPNPDMCLPGDFCSLNFTSGIGYQCYTLCVPGFGNGGTVHCQAEGFTFCLPLTPQAGVCI